MNPDHRNKKERIEIEAYTIRFIIDLIKADNYKYNLKNKTKYYNNKRKMLWIKLREWKKI